MAEKKSEKKLLVLLVVLVVLSLVVNLLSLNVLYSISKSGNLGGELAAYGYGGYVPGNYPSLSSSSSSSDSSEDSDCSVSFRSSWPPGSCKYNCIESHAKCVYDVCVSKENCNEDCNFDQGCVLQCTWDADIKYAKCKNESTSCLGKCY